MPGRVHTVSLSGGLHLRFPFVGLWDTAPIRWRESPNGSPERPNRPMKHPDPWNTCNHVCIGASRMWGQGEIGRGEGVVLSSPRGTLQDGPFEIASGSRLPLQAAVAEGSAPKVSVLGRAQRRMSGRTPSLVPGDSHTGCRMPGYPWTHPCHADQPVPGHIVPYRIRQPMNAGDRQGIRLQVSNHDTMPPRSIPSHSALNQRPPSPHFKKSTPPSTIKAQPATPRISTGG